MEFFYDDNRNPEAVYRLWQEIFRDSEAFATYYFTWIYPKNQVILAAEGGRICAMLHLNPYLWNWELERRSPRLFKLHYIVGVATVPERRRQGLMAACMKKALQNLEAKEEPFTYLMPARKEYYTPFQFVEFKKEKRWIRKGDGWMRKEMPSGFLDSSPLSSIPTPGTGMLPVRTPDYMERLKAEVECEGGAVLEWEEEAGYCAYVMEQQEGQETAVIRQLWMAAMDTEQVLNQLVCPELERRHGRVAVEYIEEQPMMLRILHLQRFLELLPYKGNEKSCIVHIKDSICSRNQGVFLLTLSPEGGRLLRLSEEMEGTFPGIPEHHWDMAELTKYLLMESGLAEQIYLMEIV